MAVKSIDIVEPPKMDELQTRMRGMTFAPTMERMRAASSSEDLAAAPAKIVVQNLSFHYGDVQALTDVSLTIAKKRVTAFIGPSGCGKSTFLRCLNRMNDMIENTRVQGNVLLDGKDIYRPGCDVVELRKQVGMVFQKSNPFPKSIFENVAYGPRLAGIRLAPAGGD